jgi:transcriptional regulator with XRE-family HTH domain
VNSPNSISRRFREAREQAKLSQEEAAERLGISAECVRDIESHEEEIGILYSPAQIAKFCKMLGIRPAELFAIKTTEQPIDAEELIERIHQKVRSRAISLEQFENAVGWQLAQSIEPPQRLLENITINGLQWLCRELDLDWHRVVLSL